MDTNVRCKVLCKEVNLTPEQSKTIGKRIQQNYYVHL